MTTTHLSMRILWPLLAAALASAHPMGNFSVNHYTCLRPAGDRVSVTYVVHLAESPAYHVQSKGVPPVFDWVHRLRFVSRGQALAPCIEARRIELQPGSGGLSTLRARSN
jgi:nickel/cobalt exporter